VEEDEHGGARLGGVGDIQQPVPLVAQPERLVPPAVEPSSRRAGGPGPEAEAGLVGVINHARRCHAASELGLPPRSVQRTTRRVPSQRSGAKWRLRAPPAP
jgi:hypothetical protein